MPTVPEKQEQIKEQGSFFKKDEIADFGAKMAEEETRVLNTHLKAGREVNPGLAGRVATMQTKTGLPSQEVAANIDDLEIQDQTQALPSDFWRKSPLTAEYIRKNSPFYSGMSDEEILGMGNTESLLAKDPRSWRRPKKDIDREVEKFRERVQTRATEELGRLREQFDISPFGDDEDERSQRFVEREVEDFREQIEFEEDFIGSDAPIGGIESIKKRFQENSVFMVPFVSAVGDVTRLTELFTAATAIEDGSATQDQTDLLVRYGRVAEASGRRGQSVLGITASIGAELIPFAVELGLTAGVFTAGKNITKKSLEAGAEKLLRGSIAKVLKRKLPGSLGTVGEFGTRNASRIVGTLAQSVAAGPGRIAASTIQTMTPIGQTQFGADGSVSFSVAPKSGKAFGVSLGEGVFRQFAEVFTEKLGGPIGRAFAKSSVGKALAKRFTPAGGKAASLQQSLQKLGIHGVFSEMGEEEANKLLLDLGGLETYRLPTGKEIKGQLLAFGAPTVTVGAAGLAFDRSRASQTEAYLESLAEETLQDETMQENSPIEYKRMVHESVKGTDKDTVNMPIEQFNQLFRGKTDEEGNPITPREVISGIMGDAKAYDEAMETGGSIEIPTEEYALTLNQGDFAEDVRKISTFDPLDVTSAETERILDELESNVQEQEGGLEAQEARAQAALSAQRVADDIQDQLLGKKIKVKVDVTEKGKKTGQIREADRVIDSVTASHYATLYERVFRTLGLRSGQDPFELYQKFQLKVTEKRDGKQPTTPEGRELSRADLEATVREEGVKLEESGELRRQALAELADPSIESDAVAVAETVGALEKEERRAKKAIKEAQKRQGELERDGADAKVFFQGPSTVRGRVSFGTDHKVDISMFETADLTTFIHESGHFFLELMKDISSAKDAPIELKEDFQRIKDWFKEVPLEKALFQIEMNVKGLERAAKSDKDLEGTAKSAREAFEMAKKGGKKFMDEFIDSFGENVDRKHFGVLMTPYHEQWARGFEMYLADPNSSPVKELNGLFHRFRDWIVNAYRDLRRLNVQLSTEIKNVMDRMLATKEEIQESQAEQGMVPLFPDPKAVGMTDEQAASYEKDISDALRKAEEDLSSKAIELDIRTKTKKWKERRAEVEPQVEAEANDMRVYKALSIMQKGENADGTSLDSGVFPMKLDKKDLLDKIGAERLAALPKPNIYTTKEGIDLATSATMLGYPSVEEMVLELELSVPKAEFIKEETERRLHEELGDPLSPDALPEEVDKAIHNEKRSQLLKKELDYLVSDNFATFTKLARKITRPVPTIKEVRERAEVIISGKEVGKISPIIYKRGETKASKTAIEAMLKGDFETVVEAKQLELLNHELFRAATAANEKVAKDMKSFRPIRKANKKTSKNRDMQMVNVAKGLLFEYGLGKPTDKPLQDHIDFLRKYGRSDQADVLVDLTATVAATAKPFKEATFEEFQLMSKTVQSLWKLSKSAKEMEIEGKRVSINDAVSELNPLIEERNQFKDAPDESTMFGDTSKQDIKRGILGWKSTFTRMGSWVRSMDKGSVTGPFRKFLFNPVREGVTQATLKSAEFIEKFQEDLKAIEENITREEIKAPEIDFVFKDKAELLGAMLHIGNDSNLSKLLRGYDWGRFDENKELDSANWERFRRRMEDEGVLTKEDYQFLQKTWDIFEETKTFAQRAHNLLYGFFFNEVTSNEFETSFGKFKGGYTPAVIDYANMQNINEATQKGLVRDDELKDLNNSFMFPTTAKGFTETRQEDYARPLQMSLELVPMHISKVMRFSFIEPPVRDVYDLITNKSFSETLNAFDPTVISHLINPWLERVAKQRISTPSDGMFGGKLQDSIFRAIRKRSSQSIMFLSAVNALQQFTGISVAATKVKPRYLRGAFVEYMKNWKTFSEDISNKSGLMATRNTTSVIEQLNNVEEIVIKPKATAKMRKFADKHALFMQIATQNVVDNLVWDAAYNEAVQDLGLLDKEAILHADAMVEETQGGFDAVNISRGEAGTPFQKLFLTFYGYFNMLANTLGAEFSIAARTTTGFDKGARMFYIYMMGVMIPAVVAESISVALRGDPDEDDDEEYLDDFVGLFFGSQTRTLTAAVPGGGVVQSILNKFNDKWYDDRISLSPAISQLERAGKSIKSVSDAIQDKGKTSTAVKDSLALFNLLFGLPTGQAGKTGGFFIDIAEDEQDADGFLEFSKGIIGGRSNP